MRVFKAVQGNGQTVTLICPTLVAGRDLPETISLGWRVTNAGCCTVLDEGDFTITITGSLYGKGAVTILAVTSAGSYDAASLTFKLACDGWLQSLPQINAEIENLLALYLTPYGWQ